MEFYKAKNGDFYLKECKKCIGKQYVQFIMDHEKNSRFAELLRGNEAKNEGNIFRVHLSDKELKEEFEALFKKDGVVEYIKKHMQPHMKDDFERYFPEFFEPEKKEVKIASAKKEDNKKAPKDEVKV